MPAQSVRQVPLTQFLRADEACWRGHIQITANNRLVTHVVKHSFADPGHITAMEHLDPFRADPTHFPFFAGRATFSATGE